MIFKPKIKNFLKHIPLLLLALAFVFNLNTLQAHAGPTMDEAAAALFADLTGVGGGRDSATVPSGVSARQTGYLCYILEANGNDPGLPAYAFQSNKDFTELPGVGWYATSRKGHTVTGWEAVCPWNITPFNRDKSTNQAAIKEWMSQTTDGTLNAVDFVNSYWNEDVAIKFKQGEYILVVETLLHFQYSIPNEYMSGPPTVDLGEIEIGLKKLYGESFKPSAEFISGVRNRLNEKYRIEWEESGGVSGYTKVGSPIVATISNCINYYNNFIASYGPNWFMEYTHRVVPFAEMITSGGAGEAAGFVPWTGSTSTQVPKANESSLQGLAGVAMFVIKAKDNGIHTYNFIDSPGAPENPEPNKTGTCAIVKGYYEHNLTTNTKTPSGAGVYSVENCTNNIIVDAEPEYEVVSWHVTNTVDKEGVDPTNWNPAGTPTRQGKTPTSLTLTTPTEKCVYVLLRKVTEDAPVVTNYNYYLPEDMITRRVWFSRPDAYLTDTGLTLTNKIHEQSFYQNNLHIREQHSENQSTN